MSKRTLRRAAERQAHKSDRKLQLAAQAAVATSAPEPPSQIKESEPTPMNVSFDQTPEINQFPRIPAPTITRVSALPFESPEALQALRTSIYNEHQPKSDTEQRLADSMVQHYWLKERALLLQEQLMHCATDALDVDAKKLALFVRYQSTHERSYYKALTELRNIKKEQRKEQIGFESQNRTEEAHQARVRLTNAQACNLEIDIACRKVIEVPLPGNETITFEELAETCGKAITRYVYNKQMKAAA